MKQLLFTILSLALAGLGFKWVFNAFRDGEAWVDGEGGSVFTTCLLVSMLMLQVSGRADAGLGQAKAGSGSHWSFQKPDAPAVPSVRDSAWPRSEVDRFLLAKLEGAGLAPLGQADKRTLIRRATYDLTGLPPTPAEVDAFLEDPSPRAFAHVVERLLASERYGERWGRHWLYVVRYADSVGNPGESRYGMTCLRQPLALLSIITDRSVCNQ